MWAIKLLAIITLAYVIILGAVFAFQTSLLFPTRLVGGSGPLPAGAERLVVEAAGEQLQGIHIPPASPTIAKPTVVLGFAGNAWNAQNAAEYLHSIYPQRPVIAFHYRGYRPSGGAPSAVAMLADAVPIHDAVAERLGTRQIVAVGFSVGGGVAAHLASRRKLAGLILVTPFDSLEAVTRDLYPWLPVRLLLRHRMEPADSLRDLQLPVAIIAAEGDTLVPRRRTEALLRTIPNLVLDRTIKGAGHNDIYQHPAFRDAMVEALGLIEKSTVRPGQ